MDKPEKFKKYDKNLLWEIPIEIYGLHIYPVIMRNIYDFYDSISTLQINPMELNFGEMRDQLLTLSYLELMVLLSQNDKGFSERFLKILKLAFRVSDESIRIIIKDEKVCLLIIQDGKEIELSSGKFNRVKDIICYQNAVEVVDLTQNLSIMEANRRLDAVNNAGSNLTLEDQVFAVAAISQVDIKDVEKWSIYRFKKMTEAHDTIINYKIFKSAEMGGMVSFKNGNPFNSWMAKPKDTSKDLKTIGELAKTFGMNDSSD